MSTTYTVPDNPADPEAAALELIVRMPDIVGRSTPHLREVVRELSMLLEIERAFEGLSWHDAKHAAVAIIADAMSQDDPVAFLRYRAVLAAAGEDRMAWDDRDAMVRAFEVGAKVLSL